MNISPQELEELISLSVGKAVDSIVEVFPKNPDMLENSRFHVWREGDVTWVRVTLQFGSTKHTARVHFGALSESSAEDVIASIRQEVESAVKVVAGRLVEGAFAEAMRPFAWRNK